MSAAAFFDRGLAPAELETVNIEGVLVAFSRFGVLPASLSCTTRRPRPRLIFWRSLWCETDLQSEFTFEDLAVHRFECLYRLPVGRRRSARMRRAQNSVIHVIDTLLHVVIHRHPCMCSAIRVTLLTLSFFSDGFLLSFQFTSLHH